MPGSACNAASMRSGGSLRAEPDGAANRRSLRRRLEASGAATDTSTNDPGRDQEAAGSPRADRGGAGDDCEGGRAFPCARGGWPAVGLRGHPCDPTRESSAARRPRCDIGVAPWPPSWAPSSAGRRAVCSRWPVRPGTPSRTTRGRGAILPPFQVEPLRGAPDRGGGQRPGQVVARAGRPRRRRPGAGGLGRARRPAGPPLRLRPPRGPAPRLGPSPPRGGRLMARPAGAVRRAQRAGGGARSRRLSGRLAPRPETIRVPTPRLAAGLRGHQRQHAGEPLTPVSARSSASRSDPRPAGFRPAVAGQDAGAPARVTRRAGAQRRTAKPLTRAGVEATRVPDLGRRAVELPSRLPGVREPTVCFRDSAEPIPGPFVHSRAKETSPGARCRRTSPSARAAPTSSARPARRNAVFALRFLRRAGDGAHAARPRPSRPTSPA